MPTTTQKPPWSNYTIEVSYEPIQQEKKSNFLVIDTAELYQAHVIEPLQEKGQKMQKTANIYTWPLGIASEWGTKDISGQVETSKLIGDNEVSDNQKANAKKELFLVFSSHAYNYAQALKTYTLVHQLAADVKSELAPDEVSAIMTGKLRYRLNTKAYGMWTMDAASLNSKYNLAEDKAVPNVFVPKKESLRILAPINKTEGYSGIEIPCNWGNFRIADGGHIGIEISEDENNPIDFHQFQKNIEILKKGEGDVFNLFLANTKDGLRSQLDIYGLEPGFVANSYQNV